jgi:hypothetical protein
LPVTELLKVSAVADFFQQLLTFFSNCCLFSATAEKIQQLLKKSSN